MIRCLFLLFALCSTLTVALADNDLPKEPQRSEKSALADAAERKHVDAVRTLVSKGANLDMAQVDGMTALHWAIYHDDVGATKLLVQAGANINAKTRYGVTPLSIACTNGNTRTVELLLEAGADPKATVPGGETPLMTAARTGRLGPVQALLARNVNVNAQEHKHNTALMWAAAEGNLDVVNALLAAGADYRTPLESGFTPLFFAVREGQTETALRLLAAGLDVDAPMQGEWKKNGSNPLLLAVENGHFETAVALLEAGADPKAQPKGHAALHAISWVRKPIRGDGDPPPVGSGNVSALRFVRALVAHGADVNERLRNGHRGKADFTTTGSTPLVLAARTGDLTLMETLLDLGADPTLTNADNSTALVAAAGVGDLGSGQQAAGTEEEAINAVALLLRLGADINAVDDNGETAMHGAAYQNWPNLVNFLAANGANPTAWTRQNKWAWTPLMIAQGYRKGNFRPDVATIEAIEQVILDAGMKLPPPPGEDVEANQQSWDKKPESETPKKASPAEKLPAASAEKR